MIAVTDNFDSTRKEDMESLALPIRNMVNTMYAKDISKKVWTSLQRKKEAGYAVGSDAPFGYIRNPVTKRNEIDPETAFYVQLIFQWVLMGVAIFEIARRLTLLKVPTPREWHRKIVEGKEVVTYKKWGETSVRHMLANQTYVGDTINNKSTQRFFAGQDKRDLSKEQWYVAKNTHPAIIARDDFEKVQKILDKNRAVFQTVRAKSEQIRSEYQNDLAGMVFCADCGAKMYNHRGIRKKADGKEYPSDFYNCSTYCLTIERETKQCFSHNVSTKALTELVLETIRTTASYAIQNKEEFIQKVRSISQVRQQEAAKELKRKVAKAKKRIAELDMLIKKLYETYAMGKLEEKRFEMLSAEYEKEQDELEQALASDQADLDQFNEDTDRADKFLALAKKYTDFSELTAPMINEFVEKIVVHAPDRSTGERIQEIEIYLKFIGKFDVPMPEPTPEELAVEEKRRQKRIRDHEKYLRQKERKKKIAEGQIVPGEPYVLVCQCCGETFRSIRPNAKFCTPACRQRFYRQQKRELPPSDAVSDPEPMETNKTA